MTGSDTMSRPEIGTPIYIVAEHLYYIPARRAPLKEFVVVPGKIEGYYTGRYVEIISKAILPEKGRTPLYFKLSQLDKAFVFLTAKGAALFAKELTEREERSSLFTACGYPPIRRTWEEYLQ